MTSKKHSFILFKKTPSFVDGAASIIDHSSLYARYDISNTEKEADFKSLLADWLAVGSDMTDALQIYASRKVQY